MLILHKHFQISNLQSRIRDEGEVVEKRIEGILGDWDKSKPIQVSSFLLFNFIIVFKGAQRPKEAINSLGSFEEKLIKLREDRENMLKAKVALEMPDAIGMSTQMNKLDVALEELNDLKGVWKSLSPIYDNVDEMKEKTWLSVQPRKLRQSLDELLANLKQLPSQYRSYESYDFAKRMLQNYSKVNQFNGNETTYRRGGGIFQKVSEFWTKFFLIWTKFRNFGLNFWNFGQNFPELWLKFSGIVDKIPELWT